MKRSIQIGTSGWSYEHWKENFYPKNLKSTDWLHFYSQTFNTVEINTTFYHLPRTTSVHKWLLDVPKPFRFSIKASRYITHQKRLHDCKESLKTFYGSIKELIPKTGPILFQLPPSFQINIERLEEFLSLLTNEYQYTFEFRHPTWFTESIYDLLTQHNIALCITDLNGTLSPEIITADFTYIRLHGPKKAYRGFYDTKELNTWRKKLEKWKENDVSSYCYLDNDEKGYAIQNAKLLKDMLHENGQI